MSLSDGQQRALEQLRDVAAQAGELLTVDAVREPATPGAPLEVDITLSCADLEQAADGLPLQDREQVVVLVPARFPFTEPHAVVRHDRFAGFPHVQWKFSLCLYQAPSTEWNPSDGMFGFLTRLHLFFQQGALNQLDPNGAAIHPPVAYLGDGPLRTIIPRVNTPAVAAEPWFGTAHLRVVTALRADIVGWSPHLDKDTPPGVAAVVLMPTTFPYDFPSNVADLIGALEERGVSRRRLFLTLQWAAIHNEKGAPLYVILGTPMRGVRGGVRHQHLTAWHLEPIIAWGLKEAIESYSEDELEKAYGERIESIILDWAKVAPVSWCAVREDRPEIVTRRDRGAPLAWFAGKTVAVWGCGALGGHVAEYLARAAVKKLVLRDNGVVTPGILVRQPFDDADIGNAKACAMRDRLLRIRPDLEVEVSLGSVLVEPLDDPDWVAGADAVIDATASGPVLGLLELRRWRSGVKPVPIISMAIGHDADRGMVVIVSPRHSGGPLDASRRLKLEACARPELAAFLEEFWPTVRRPFFQPEPGCSDATFVGSAADVAGLAAQMLNRAAADLGEPTGMAPATGHFLAQPHAPASRGPMRESFAWDPDHVSMDVHAGYQVRIAPAAWDALRGWIGKSRDEAGPAVETGGLLFGERDDAAGVIWVSEVGGPPPDSEASAEKFVCGVEGTAESNAERRDRTRGSVHYVGMWHTHPTAEPLPSPTDWVGMRRLVRSAGGGGRSLMLIVGCPHDRPMLGTYVFRAADFDAPHGSTVIRLCAIRVVDWEGDRIASRPRYPARLVAADDR